MPDSLESLPLFPLNTVLFPSATLQLHVFEDRYRQMVRHCLDFDAPFGIVLIRSGAEVGGSADPYLVGTAVRIQQVHHFDDGRMDILVQGERRFRIREFDESRPYLVGKVEPIIELEIEPGPETDALLDRVRNAFEQFIQAMFARQDFQVQVVLSEDPVMLSFTIANMLAMEDLEKQRLLETTDTLDRLGELLPILEGAVAQATTQQYYRVGPRELSEWITPN